MASKRASYKEAVQWIALNDEPEDMDPESVASFISTCLVADLWGRDTIVVAVDVLKVRKKANKASMDAGVKHQWSR